MKSPASRLCAIVGVFATALALAACTAAPTGDGALSTSSSSAGEPSAAPTAAATIEPVLVVAGVDIDGKHVTASGYVQGVIQDGGTCSFVFAREGSTTVTVDRSGVADRLSTSCGAVQPETTEFVRGTWSITLKYESASGSFSSQPETLEVP